MDINQWLEENPLVEHELIQGSPEWIAYRVDRDGSSEAAPMLGLSKNLSRTELLDMKATGMAKEFSAWVQKNILDYGHEVEALARPIVEKRLGRKLYPVVCSRGRTSASCDGMTMSGDVAWEHKQWSEALAASVAKGILPEEHMPQCQQVMMVTGASKLIFTVSDGTQEKMVYMEVRPDNDWFLRILAGWAQFHKDLSEHKPREIAERPAAEVSIDLPALFVHARGEITTSNMQEYGYALATKLAEVRAIQLVTDQDFSNAKEAARLFREQIGKLKLAKEAMLSQTATIGEAARMIDAWGEDLRVTALQLEKGVEREDLAKKRAMTMEASAKWREHIDALEQETEPIRLTVAQPDFAAAIKGKRSYASMQDAVDTAMANAKSAADTIARDTRGKLAWFGEYAKGYEALFADLQQIIYKPEDDFDLLVETRIKAHKQAEAEKLETERRRIQQEEEANARAKVEAKERESAAQSAAETPSPAPASDVAATEQIKLADVQKSAPAPQRPTDAQIIGVLAVHYGVCEQTARKWISDMNLRVAEEKK